MTLPPVAGLQLERRFHIADILSVVTGQVLSARGARGVDALFRYMAGQYAVPHAELARYVEDFRAAIVGTYPDLATFLETDPPPEFADVWVRRRVQEFGAYLAVPRLPIDHPLRRAESGRTEESCD